MWGTSPADFSTGGTRPPVPPPPAFGVHGPGFCGSWWSRVALHLRQMRSCLRTPQTGWAPQRQRYRACPECPYAGYATAGNEAAYIFSVDNTILTNSVYLFLTKLRRSNIFLKESDMNEFANEIWRHIRSTYVCGSFRISPFAKHLSRNFWQFE